MTSDAHLLALPLSLSRIAGINKIGEISKQVTSTIMPAVQVVNSEMRKKSGVATDNAGVAAASSPNHAHITKKTTIAMPSKSQLLIMYLSRRCRKSAPANLQPS
jgi:hypothetical protein